MQRASAGKTAPKIQDLTLIADIGATNGRFALLKPSGEITDVVYLACKDFPGFIEAATQYMADVRMRPAQSVIAVACPVLGDEIKLTNNHWHFSIRQAQAHLGFKNLKVVNDFTAQALAMPALQASDMKHLGGRQKQAGEKLPIAVIGPGTGLGVGGLIADASGQWIPIVTEGGHVTCPAVTEEEERILSFLRQRYDHVSAERVLSGLGLRNLYDAHCHFAGATPEDIDAAAITERAMRRSCPQSTKAAKNFSEILGTVSGNLALTMGALGGLYIAGGIVKKMAHAFDERAFRQRFEAKGPMSHLLQSIPTYMVTSSHVAFLGLRSLAQGEG